MYTRNILALAILCAAAVTPLAGQQATYSARPAPVSVAPTTAPDTTLRGPRVSPGFQSFQPRLAPRNALAAAGEGGQHVIVISTLALVLGIIVIVLLVAN